MKRICIRFLPSRLSHPLAELIGETASEDLQKVALSFIQLQDARHSADYDLSYEITYADGLKMVETAVNATGAWQRLEKTAEANIFILSLLLWKNWEKERI